MTYLSTEPPDTGAPASGERAGSRRALGCAFEIVETLVLTLLIYLVIHNFVAQPFEVQQRSMVPTIAPAEYILIDKLTPRFDGYHYGDVVVFEPPNAEPGTDPTPFIKRIIGLPGDTVSLDVEGGTAPTLCPDPDCPNAWEIPAGSYFVMGDNRLESQDSRSFGPIEEELILGRAWLRYFPLERVGIIERPAYGNLPDRDDEATTAGE